MNTLRELESRGLASIVSDPALADEFDKGPVNFYIGFDPSHNSLQVGNLFAIVTMARLQRLGHNPVALVGGATGMIGDPSGRSTERNLLTLEKLHANVAGIRGQLERLLDFTGPHAVRLVNNHDWLGPMSFLDFLRDVGPRFRVTEMLAKESVKRRLESNDGMSYTEFAYQILQAYDFLHLYRTQNIHLQMGGADQWGNIAAGIDLIRRVEGGHAYGMCIPLVTDAAGNKFGKSLGGAIYLDAEQTSPYRMYQYFLNAEDAKVGEYLRFFTFLPLDEIAAMERAAADDPGARIPQKTLAAEVVRFVHGEAGVATAERATRVFFGAEVADLTEADLAAVFADVPSSTITRSEWAEGLTAVDALARTDLFKGKNDARRAVEQRGAYINNRPVASVDARLTTEDWVNGTTLVIRRGKKQYALLRLRDDDA